MARASLVTGAHGFVGRHLVDALVARGDRVRAVDIAKETTLEGAEYIPGDIRDIDAMQKACEGVDVVFHNASVVHTRRTQKEAVFSINLDGTRRMLEAARAAGVKRFVYVSSASVVYEGRDIEDGDESLPSSSISQAPYADSKIAAEKLVLDEDGKGGMHTCSIRPHVIFGPGDTRFLPAILDRAKAGKLKLGVGREHKLSDFTYVSNLVDALLLADDKLAEDPQGPVGGEAYFITNGEPRPFFGFVSQVLEGLDLPPIKGMVPFWLAYSVAAVREGVDAVRGTEVGVANGMSRFAIRYMCTHHYFSIDKAKRDLGYEPRVDLDEGIAKTVEHLKSVGAV